MTDDQTPLEQQDIPTEGTLIAIPISWAHSPSGCVEWRLVDWTVPDDDGQRLPVWADVAGDTGAWGDDYALRRPQDDDWCFPDGERCDDENLSAAFARRKRHRADASSGGNDTGRKLRRAPARPDADMKPTKNKQGSDAPGKLMMALVQFEDPNQLCAGMRALRVEGFETKFLDRWADPEGSRMVWVLAWITIAADRERGFLSYVWDIVDEFSGMPDEAGPTTAADLIAYEDPAYWNLSKTYRKHWLAMTTAHAAFMTAVADYCDSDRSSRHWQRLRTRLRALGRATTRSDNYLAGLCDGRDLVTEPDPHGFGFNLLHALVHERAKPFINYWVDALDAVNKGIELTIRSGDSPRWMDDQT